MKRSGEEAQKVLPPGFGVTKKRKTQAKNSKDRTLIQALSKEATNIIKLNFDANVKSTCSQVIQDYYQKNKIPKVCYKFKYYLPILSIYLVVLNIK